MHNTRPHPAQRQLWQRVMQPLQLVWQHAVAVAIPSTCIICQRALPATEPMGTCATCFHTLPWWNPSQQLPPTLPAVISSFAAPCRYAEPLRHALHQFKFHDGTHLATPLAKLLRPVLPPASSPWLLVPVPSHPSRLQHRLYNHAALLAVAAGKQHGLPVAANALVKLTASKPQHTLTRSVRQRLSGHAFAAQANQVHGQHVILIDDILTTGATAHACALALLRGGAASVHVRTLAYTLPG